MLSVIIPTLNAGATLGACLVALDGADEIIVVDGGSRDESVAIAEQGGVRLVHAPKGRGIQLKAGGAAARGDWLLFVHADTRLAPGWREAVTGRARHGDDVVACFRFGLDDDAWQARVIELGVALRVRLFGLSYGDQCLLVSRRLYDEVGGFAALPIMEDVDLVRRLGRRRLRVLPAVAITSAERWRRDGWWVRSARNLLCLLLYSLGVSPARIARLYA